jgi:hypothetical protein
LQDEHLLKSRQFNNTIYHYSKFLIYFYLMKDGDASTHALTLQNQESRWMKEAEDLMSLDNFPSSAAGREQCFLLHPNSLHFIFYHNKINGVSRYDSEQIKYYLLEFLSRRRLLTSAIHAYLCQYWKDIIRLLAEWQRSEAWRPKETGGRKHYVEC